MQKYKATLMDEAAIGRALKRISHEIVEHNNGCKNLCIVGIKRRGIPLSKIIAANIMKIENSFVQTAVLDTALFRDDISGISEDEVLHRTGIDMDVTGKAVILVDDVLYTGRTARAAMEAVMSCGRPSSIQLAVLIDRGHRELPIRGDYVGKNIPTSKNERIAVKLPPFDDITAVQLYG